MSDTTPTAEAVQPIPDAGPVQLPDPDLVLDEVDDVAFVRCLLWPARSTAGGRDLAEVLLRDLREHRVAVKEPTVVVRVTVELLACDGGGDR